VDGSGEIGVIASVTQPFCRTCTRAQLSAEGWLYTCLFASQGHIYKQVHYSTLTLRVTDTSHMRTTRTQRARIGAPTLTESADRRNNSDVVGRGSPDRHVTPLTNHSRGCLLMVDGGRDTGKGGARHGYVRIRVPGVRRALSGHGADARARPLEGATADLPEMRAAARASGRLALRV